MGDNLGLLRFYFVLLLIFTIGRWGLSLGGVDYDAAHQVFSIVILTSLSAAHYAAFTRAFKGYRIGQAVMLGVIMAVVSQLVILISTAVSYMAGMETYFNAPRALNVEEAVGFGQAMIIRAQGLIANTIVGVVSASLGWAIGGVLPRESAGA
jgi:hypothetical protein